MGRAGRIRWLLVLVFACSLLLVPPAAAGPKVQLVKDLNPGGFDGDAIDLTVVDGRLYFSGVGPGSVKSVWVSDGTGAGTRPIFMLNRGDPNQYAGSLARAGNRVVATATRSDSGREMWGVAAGEEPELLFEAVPGPDWSVLEIGPSAGTDLLIRTVSGPGPALVRTNGTSAGTATVAPESITGVGNIVPFQGDLVFGAYGPQGGPAIFRLEPATNEVSKLSPSGTFDFLPNCEVASSSYVFCTEGVGVNTAVFSTDGTSAAPSEMPVNMSNQRAPYEGRMAGSANAAILPATAPGTGVEPWRSNGTVAGTNLLADIDRGSGSSSFQPIGTVRGLAVFSASDAKAGAEPWVSDGTRKGTHRLKDIFRGDRGSRPELVTATAKRLYFSAANRKSGVELWETDGTKRGTRMTAEFSEDDDTCTCPLSVARMGRWLYVSANADRRVGRELYRLRY